MVARRSQNGFSLMELLVAILISAVFAIMVTRISLWLGNTDQILERADRIEAIQKTVRILQRDLRQMQPRPARDLIGEGHVPSLAITDANQGLIFTTSGWLNPLGEPRSALQRVQYIIEDEQLVRLRWPRLDGLQSSTPTRSVMLEGVDNLSWRFLSDDLTWSDTWPPIALAAPSHRSLPRAIEWRITLNDWGELLHLAELVR